MRRAAIGAALACCSLGAAAQVVVHADETLSSTRPEAWAMAYAVAPTFFTAFGATPTRPAGSWAATIEAGHIPRLSASQQRVGFLGTTQADLNRSPVFGRLRLLAGLPAGFVAELGYTPNVTIADTRARNVVAVALGRRLLEHRGFAVGVRAFAQRGSASGDITCPARVVGAGARDNPAGCSAPSNDRIDLRYAGADATVGWGPGPWQLHATVGVVRTDLAVQVDALTGGVLDQSRLDSTATRRYVAAGARWQLDGHWSLAGEVLHVPLKVERSFGGSRESDPFTGLRLQLAYRFS